MMTIREKAEYIIRDIKREQGTNPVTIFRNIAAKDYVSMHGPERHILDGASLLVAYKNACVRWLQRSLPFPCLLCPIFLQQILKFPGFV